MVPYLLSGDAPAEGGVFNYVFNHALDHGYKFRVMMLIAAGILLLSGLVTNKSSLAPHGFFRNAFESLVLFIRDGMVRPSMGGHHGDRYVPFFCTLFVFILVCNLLGMVPGAGTATSTLMMTGALAGIVLIVSVGSGLFFHRGHFLQLFVPPGLPKVLMPLLFVLEFAGFFIKHGVLSIRLFANMIAGHLVIGAFIGLIFLFESWTVPAPAVLLAVFISLLELLVAFLQAYVFTLLSVLFVGGMVHPEH